MMMMIFVLDGDVIGLLTIELVHYDRSKWFAVISGCVHEEFILLLPGRSTEIVINLLLQLVFDFFFHGVSHAFFLRYLAHLRQGTHLKLDSGPCIVDIGRRSG